MADGSACKRYDITHPIRSSNCALALVPQPVLFILFICVAVFVVLNVLIAIISDAYSDAQESLMHSNDVALGQEIKDYVLNTIEGVPVLGKWFHKGRMKTAEMAAKVQTHGAKTLSTVSRKSRGLLKPISRSPSGDSKGQTPDNFAETKSVAAVRRHSLSNPAPGMLVADGPTRRGGNGTNSATTSPSHHASSSHEQAMMPGMIASEVRLTARAERCVALTDHVVLRSELTGEDGSHVARCYTCCCMAGM